MASQDTTISASSQPAPDIAMDNNKRQFHSPPPPPDSMTPPPSTTQAPPPLRQAAARTPTPTLSHLSSPPPTIKATPAHHDFDSSIGPYTFEQLANATTEDLLVIISETDAAYRAAKTTAAHQALQYNLLSMEKSETIKRMEVELNMAYKEVDVLQSFRRTALHTIDQPVSTTDELYVNALKQQCKDLESQNSMLTRQLDQAKEIILERDAWMTAENDRLKNRIRVNREHFTLILQLKGIRGDSPPFSTDIMDSPRNKGRDAFQQIPSTPKSREDAPFAQLLMADHYLSQATAPSTPTGRQTKMHSVSHQHLQHPASSVPSTPIQARTVPPTSKNYPQTFLYHSNAKLPQTPLTQKRTAPTHRRRESRDSTISASDNDGDSNIDDIDDIPTSQASQEAANILRKSSFRNSEGAASPKSHGALRQTKIYGSTKKPGIDRSDRGVKRKLFVEANNASPRSTKKGKMNEGIGLGIGGWVSPEK